MVPKQTKNHIESQATDRSRGGLVHLRPTRAMMLVAAVLVAIVVIFIIYANRAEPPGFAESIDFDAMMREGTPVEEQITRQDVAAQGQKKEPPLAKEVEKPQAMVVGAAPLQEQAVPLPSEAGSSEPDSSSFKKSKLAAVAKTEESLVESADQFERKESADNSPGEEKLDVAIAATPKQSTPRRITSGALTILLSQFVSSYDAGNLDGFMTLFAEDAHTNKRRNRDQIRTDYDDLFQTTDRRRLTLIDVNWEPGNDAVQGWGRFEVKVRKKGRPEVTTFVGGLRFRVEKPGPQIRIAHLYHTQTKVNVTVSDVE